MTAFEETVLEAILAGQIVFPSTDELAVIRGFAAIQLAKAQAGDDWVLYQCQMEQDEAVIALTVTVQRYRGWNGAEPLYDLHDSGSIEMGPRLECYLHTWDALEIGAEGERG